MKKEESIETLRGLAILLMVSGHVIGDTINAGLRVADDSAYRYFYHSLEYLRMPLFTVISGYVYSLRPLKQGSEFGFLSGKAHRILLPFLFVGTAQFLMRTVAPGINSPRSLGDLWRFYVYGGDQFWFLQAIFLIFLAVTALEYFRMLASPRKWFLCFAAASTLFLLQFVPTTIFSWQGALYLFPYFLLGIGFQRFNDIVANDYVVYFSAMFFGIAVVIHQSALLGITDIDVSENLSFLSLLMGVTGNILLLKFRQTWKPLARLGFYAYGIYLFHVFPVAGSRMVLGKLGVGNDFVLFLAGLSLAVAVSILIEKALAKFSLPNRLFLGIKPRRVLA